MSVILLVYTNLKLKNYESFSLLKNNLGVKKCASRMPLREALEKWILLVYAIPKACSSVHFMRIVPCPFSLFTLLVFFGDKPFYYCVIEQIDKKELYLIWSEKDDESKHKDLLWDLKVRRLLSHNASTATT